VFIEQGGTDAWEKIDNSSVLDGAGTGQKVALWSGSGTSNTLTDAPITVSGNNATFAGDIIGPANFKATGSNMKFFAGGTHVFSADLNRNIYPATHNSTDLGFSAALAFRQLYLSGDITSGAGATFAGNIIAGSNAVQNGANPGLEVRSTNTSQTVLSIDNTTTRNYELAVGGTASSIGSGSFYIYDGTAAATRLVIDTSGDATFAGLVSGITPTAAANFTTKAYVDGLTPGAGVFLPLAGGTMTGTGEIRTPDNFKLKVGTAGDMEIYHNATNTLIDNQTGNLLIQTTSGSVQINKGTAENMAEFITDGAVKLYYDSARKFETTNTGVTITGKTTSTNDIILSQTGPRIDFDNGSAGSLRLFSVSQGTAAMTLTSAGNANFSGDVTIADAALLSHQQNTDVDTGTETIAQVAIATYTAAFFDFVVKKGTNVRSGTVYACHDGTNVEYAETSTVDLGDTSDLVLTVDISAGNMRLLGTAASNDWSVKSLIRAI
jgi:hypothetical protein